MLFYVSGKLTDNGDIINDYIDVAVAYAVMLMRKGHSVIVPHLMAHEGFSGFGYERFMQMDFEILERCDAIFLIPNWINSPGAKRELKYALDNGVTVYDNIDEVPPEVHPSLRKKVQNGWNTERCANCCETTRRHLSNVQITWD